MALDALGNHRHRGAVASDGKTGDGAGIMTSIPHRFFAKVWKTLSGQTLPAPEDLAVGCVFLPLGEAGALHRCRRLLEEKLRDEGLEPLGWRDLPVDLKALGERALANRPFFQHILVERGSVEPGGAFENALYRARRRAESKARELGLQEFYVASLSNRTLVYKGLCLADQLARFYPDLQDPDYQTPVCLFHQRYSTNTYPAWALAQPFRQICHNGEFNTLAGNRNWMRAREAALPPSELKDFTPIITPDVSDSGAFDNVLEFFLRQDRKLIPCLTMMVPEIWEKVDENDLPDHWRAFYRHLSCLMEPWDGPAAISFFDGFKVGTLMDRNGLRPARYTITQDGLVVCASEAGVVDLKDRKIKQVSQLGPGEILVVDIENQEIRFNHKVKNEMALSRPFQEFNSERIRVIPDKLFYGEPFSSMSLLAIPESTTRLHRRKLAFAYSHEEEIAVIRPMIVGATEAIGSMGDDTPPAVLSEVERPFFHFFRQRFAQVTNPALDPLRESLVMSLRTLLGRRANILVESSEKTDLLEIPGPILSRAAFEYLHNLDPMLYPAIVLRTTYPVHGGAKSLAETLEAICTEAEEAVLQGASLIVLYDGELNAFRAPIPSLLAVSAVHQHLIKKGLRLRASLVVSSGEPREVHHFACLLGYGADAVYPFLALKAVADLVESGGRVFDQLTVAEAQLNFIKAVEKGLLKILAKMGIALLASYRGAQVFEVLGLDRRVVEAYFPGTNSHLGGLTLEDIAARQKNYHSLAYHEEASETLSRLASHGFYKYKKNGEIHRIPPKRTKQLHKIVKNGAAALEEHPTKSPYQVLPEGPSGFLEYAEQVEQETSTLRNLLGFATYRPSLAIEEVESLKSIVSRFSTGAMSHGSLSAEAHTDLALAMNRLGAHSNSGEGGEAKERLNQAGNSAVKQVASGRFGVTPEYLLSANEIQIKISQGSKPGEGGQIPGHKVTAEIAAIRGTKAGIALISPPPHHDIYSIEDLAQLIYDLKKVNPRAEVSVKLVSSEGIGTVAAGVAKGFADAIHISGCEGGTGASPISSVKFAGMPWEIGLAEVQQVLVANGLRERVKLRVDGGFQTGRDVLIAALLGADQFSFGTIALVAEGCLMARVCHNNTCPVGIASQKAELRAKYPGSPERVISYMLGVAHHVRVLLAHLGFSSLDEVIGRTEFLEQVVWYEKAGRMDLSPLLWRPKDNQALRHGGDRNNVSRRTRNLEHRVVEQLEESFTETMGPLEIHNTDRSFGARLAGWMLECQCESLTLQLQGHAGQSFGAFGVVGLTLNLEGAANDYVGKGLAGASLSISPSAAVRHLDGSESSICGNTCLYGATSGELFAAGRAGHRFAVRNSGATAVVEGVGEHACEYMTGGTVVILGSIGRNLGAGMTGGQVYLFDPDKIAKRKLNPELVKAVAVDDESTLKALVAKHEEKTGSKRAQALLKNWKKNLEHFWLVRPKSVVATIEAQNEGVEADLETLKVSSKGKK